MRPRTRTVPGNRVPPTALAPSLLAYRDMAVLVAQLTPIEGDDGHVYAVQACGAEREDGLWEGWLAFFDAYGGAWHTERETVQPTLAALEHWATGLTPTYLEGAFNRAVPADPRDAVADYAMPDLEQADDPGAGDPIPAFLTAVGDRVPGADRLVRGRVIAVDAVVGEVKIRRGGHLLTLQAPASALEHVRVGQLITLSVPVAG